MHKNQWQIFCISVIALHRANPFYFIEQSECCFYWILWAKTAHQMTFCIHIWFNLVTYMKTKNLSLLTRISFCVFRWLHWLWHNVEWETKSFLNKYFVLLSANMPVMNNEDNNAGLKSNIPFVTQLFSKTVQIRLSQFIQETTTNKNKADKCDNQKACCFNVKSVKMEY